MDKKLIELERNFNVYDMCSLCYATAQTRKIYNLKFGGSSKSTVRICSKCLAELKDEIKEKL